MGDSAGEPAYGFHLLGLAELLLEGAAFGDVLGKQLEEDGVAVFAEGASGEAHVDGSAVLAYPVGGQAIEFLQGPEVVRQAEPLLGIGIEVGEILADQLRTRLVAQHGDQGGIHVEQDTVRVAAADPVGSVGDQGAEVNLGAAQSFLGRAQRRVEEADQPGHEHEQSEMYDGFAVIGRSVRPSPEKYALTVKANEVATRPGFQPPYQALTMMATAKTTSRLSTTAESRNAGIRARIMLRTATPYRRMGARAGGMEWLRRRGSFARIRQI